MGLKSTELQALGIYGIVSLYLFSASECNKIVVIVTEVVFLECYDLIGSLLYAYLLNHGDRNYMLSGMIIATCFGVGF